MKSQLSLNMPRGVRSRAKGRQASVAKRLIGTGVILSVGVLLFMNHGLASRTQYLCYLGKRYANNLVSKIVPPAPCRLTIPRIRGEHDKDGDGICDADDIIAGARRDAANRPRYKNAYYRGGYPPDNEGVCTDVVWRAFRNAGYDLKTMVDQDIRDHLGEYPRVERPDPNIDFRRVPNLHSFFRRHGQSLTLRVSPGKIANLQEWQGGDIVIFGPPFNHIAVVSDRRRQDGVPYIIHNSSPYTMEEDALLYWAQKVSPIIGHYRWVAE